MHSGTEERERTSLILTLLFGGWALGVRAPETLHVLLVSRAVKGRLFVVRSRIAVVAVSVGCGERFSSGYILRVLIPIRVSISFGDLLPVALLTEPTGCLIRR